MKLTILLQHNNSQPTGRVLVVYFNRIGSFLQQNSRVLDCRKKACTPNGIIGKSKCSKNPQKISSDVYISHQAKITEHLLRSSE